ncbi:hypothetical protein [Fibrella aquatica]|uniref:hypothetical protein n=1 Tax=Fibrella aquatica TaxID=3242487 RepID=UPI0035201795
MKKLRTLLSLSLLLTSLFSQLISLGQASRRPDQIVLYNNTVIEGLISEINETLVVYRKVSAPQGARFQVKKSEVDHVRYANNDIERFDGKGNKATPAKRTAAPVASAKKPVSARDVPVRQAQPQAADADNRTRFGLTLGAGGGLWMAEGESSDMGLAFRGGITAEIPLGSSVALAPSVEFMQLSQGESPSTVALNYGVATLAIASLYKPGRSVNLFYSAGVYGAYGINITANGESATFDEANFSPLHVGAELKLGARFSPAFTVYGQGNYGITSMISVSGAPAVSQVTFGVGLRYLFGQ